jgi:hypothetical protein
VVNIRVTSAFKINTETVRDTNSFGSRHFPFCYTFRKKNLRNLFTEKTDKRVTESLTS